MNRQNNSGSDYEELRILLPLQHASFIIGTNGENIKRLHQEHCAIINIAESTTTERILTLGGNDLSIVCGALDDVLKGLYKNLNDFGFDISEPNVSILYDESQVEYITSFDEYQLNNILESSGCLMDVFLTCCPASTERVIRLKGQLFPIVECIYQFNKILKWCPVNPERVPYLATNADANKSSDYGGFAHEQQHLIQLNDSSSVSGKQDTNEERKTTQDPFETITLTFTIKNLLANIVRGPSNVRLKQICEESGAKIELTDYFKADQRLIKIEGMREEVENARDLIRLLIQNLCTRIE